VEEYFSQLLNVHNASDVRQIEMHTPEPLVSGLSLLEIQIAIAKLKKYKTPGSDQITAELIQAGGETFVSVINKLFNSIWNKEELPDQWKESISVAIHKKVIKLTVINIMISLPSTTYTILLNILLLRLSPYTDLLGIINVDFHLSDQLLIRFSAFVSYSYTSRKPMIQ
jgi:hypothetical protein